MKRYDHFIDGGWQAPQNGEYIESVDPATAEIWAEFARGGTADADLAVRAAHRAFSDGPWKTYSARQRADCLIGIADLLEQRWPELVEAEIRDNGKRIAEVNAQFAGLHTWYRYFAEQMLGLEPRTLDNHIPGVANTAHYQPYGVVVAITPWNSPLMILAWKMAPALAAGNTLVIKPSELASASTLEFARLCAETDLPPGVINVVTGLGHEAGEPLVRHALTRKVTFTGSDLGGCKVAEAAAPGVIPVTLELGGKSPQLLFADADLDNAVNGILSGIFLSNGQTCVAGSRLLVEDSIHDEVVARIVERAVEAEGRRSAAARDRDRAAGQPGASRQGAVDDRRRQSAGRRVRLRRRTAGAGRASGRLLPATDGIHRRHAGNDAVARRGLWSGAGGDKI